MVKLSSQVTKRLIALPVVLLLNAATWFAVQLSCQGGADVLKTEFKYVLTEMSILFFLGAVISLATGKSALGYGISSGIGFLYAVADYYIILYHGLPVTFDELKNIPTMFGVISGYRITVPDRVIQILILLALSVGLVVVLALLEKGCRRYSLVNSLPKGAAVLLSGAMLYFGLFSPNPIKPADAVKWAWFMSYGKYGCLSCVIEEALESINPVNQPAGYSEERTAGLEAKYRSDGAVKNEYPDIIIILNETFFDLNGIVDLKTDRNPLEELQAREDLVWGEAVVPLIKGGTNCSEYELLTGNSVYLFNTTTPFNTLDMTDADSIVRRLSSLGYTTLGAHSESGVNYNRAKGYPGVGFDLIHFGPDFRDMRTYGGRPHYTDESVYENFISWYENMGDGPRFAYVLTIQNHGEYTQSDDSYDTVHVTENYCGGYDGIVSKMNEYLTSLSLSSEALCDLYDYLAESDRDVVVLTVGDHCPGFANDLANSNESLSDSDLALRSTPYLLWSNCGIDFSEMPGRLNMFALAANLFETLGLPQTGYDKLLCELSDGHVFMSSGDVYEGSRLIAYNGDENLDKIILDYLSAEYGILTGDSRLAEYK